MAEKIRETEKKENANPEVQAKLQHLLRKRKRAQGPNPLSVKKKQKKPPQQPQQQNENSTEVRYILGIWSLYFVANLWLRAKRRSEKERVREEN